MDDESHTSGAVWFALLEGTAFAGLFLLLASSVVGDGSFMAGRPLFVRLVALVAAGVQALIPVWVVVDIHRRPEPIDPDVIHPVLLPVFNVFGLAAYIWERNRAIEAASSDEDTDEPG